MEGRPRSCSAEERPKEPVRGSPGDCCDNTGEGCGGSNPGRVSGGGEQGGTLGDGEGQWICWQFYGGRESTRSQRWLRGFWLELLQGWSCNEFRACV